MRLFLTFITICLVAFMSVPADAVDCRAQGDQRLVLSGSGTLSKRCRTVAEPAPVARAAPANSFRVGNTSVTVRGSVTIDYATRGYAKGP
jgi:hypothetical protein